MNLQALIPILFLGLAAVLFMTPEIRKHRMAKVGAAVALLGVLVVISYNFGTQAGRDAALRDNRADARAAAEAAKL